MPLTRTRLNACGEAFEMLDPEGCRDPADASCWACLRGAKGEHSTIHRIANGFRRSSSVPRVTPTRLAALSSLQTSLPVICPASNRR